MKALKYCRYLYIYILFFIFATGILLFVSTDSYLHGLNSKFDSSWFFLCGKAWMNGLTPYVDFSDSKGPLLWLIYGFGYLIDKDSYIGVFWISCFFYAITLIFVFKTVKVFLQNNKQSFIVTILCCLSYFNIFVHNEIRAEDFCQLFIVLSLYYTCRILYMPHYNFVLKIAPIVIGMGIGLALLIKFNISALLVVFPLIIIFYICKEGGKKSVIFAVRCLLSFSLVLLPFLIYFYLKKCLGAFFYEYFIRTFVTVENSNQNGSIFYSFIHKLTQPNVFLFLSIMLGCSLLPMKIFKSKKYVPLFLFFWFFLISYQNSWNYYFNNCAIFAIFGFISLMKIFLISKPNMVLFLENHVGLFMAFIFMVIVAPDVLFVPSIRNSFFLSTNKNKDDFYRFENEIVKVKEPKILYWGTLCNGNGVSANSLPACRYFAEQTGATPDMDAEQKKSVIQRKPDFIILKTEDSNKKKMLNEVGYVCVCENTDGLLLYKRL